MLLLLIYFHVHAGSLDLQLIQKSASDPVMKLVAFVYVVLAS